MSGIPPGPQNPEARATFLAALEYGISPLLAGDLYAKTDPTPRPVVAHVPPRRSKTTPQRPTPVRPGHTPRRTSIVKTAAEIMNEMNA